MSADRRQQPSNKSAFMRATAKKLSRSERRAAKAAARRGEERTVNPHIRNTVWWLN